MPCQPVRRSLILLVCALAAGTQAAAIRRILVTGANKGIGKAICKAALQQFPDVHVLLGSRDAGRGTKAVDSIVGECAKEGGLGPEVGSRISLLQIDVTDGASVRRAAAEVAERYGEGTPLFGLCNNAGIGFGKGFVSTLDTNFHGTRRVCEAFLPLLQPGGRLVNIASASAPMFVAGCAPAQSAVLTDAKVTLAELDALLGGYARATDYEDDAYGLSKACVNAYTVALARDHPLLLVNSCTPGFILTDLTRGMGASKPPEEGTRAPLHCLFGPADGSGRYYGSDCLRSPLDRYRAPGDPPHISRPRA